MSYFLERPEESRKLRLTRDREVRYCSYRKGDYYPVYYVNTKKTRLKVEEIMLVEDVYRKDMEEAGEVQNRTYKYPDMLSYFSYYPFLSTHGFTIGGEDHKLYYRQGEIRDKKGEILLLLTTNSEEIFTLEEKEITNALGRKKMRKHWVLNPSVLKLYVAIEFKSDPKYKNIYKKMMTEIIEPSFENDIDVVYAKSAKIRRELFKNDFELKFDNVTELQEMLTGGVEDFYNNATPSSMRKEAGTKYPFPPFPTNTDVENLLYNEIGGDEELEYSEDPIWA